LQEVLSAVYVLPIGKDKLFKIQSRLMDSLLGGWSLNGVMTFASGARWRLETCSTRGSRWTSIRINRMGWPSIQPPS